MQPLGVSIFSTKAPFRPADVESVLGPVTSNAGWLRKATWYEFSTPHGKFRLTIAGPEYWEGQRDGLKGYASRFLAADDPRLAAFTRQVDGFVSTYGLLGDDSLEPGDPTCQLMERFAAAVDGVLFGWGSVIVPGQGVLFGPLAEAERTQSEHPTATEAQLQGSVRTSLDHPEPTAHQLSRRTNNGEQIRAMALPVLDSLPVLEDDEAVVVRPVAEVVRRLICIAICAVKAEQDDPEFINGLIDQYQVREWLSDEEREFIKEVPSSPRNRAKFGWRYECAHVLQWWLGLEPSLLPPSQTCNAGVVVRKLKDRSTADLIEKAQPRSASDLLDAADLYYRLHWAAIELRLKRTPNAAVNEEIVMERHYALNWLITYQGADWDDVQTDT